MYLFVYYIIHDVISWVWYWFYAVI